MPESPPLTILCLASYEKGQEFIRECKAQGGRLLLVTVEKLKDADWPRECIDEIFFMPNEAPRPDWIKGVSYLARTRTFDRIVALDEFDLETAAALREHLRVPGMGETTTRYFRDKLAMRVQAKGKGIRVPEFIHVLNHDRLREFTQRVPAPWLMKPRWSASAIGIKKIHHPDELWQQLEMLGDEQSNFVLEQFVAGDIYHVDSIISEREVVFAEAHKYGQPPMSVMHQGGIYTTRTLPRNSADAKALREHNRELMQALGMVRGVAHTEFIKAQADGQFYFLETAARVGGGYISNVVQAATGINLWAEWAKIEIADDDHPYKLPEFRQDYAGVIISLARQEHPDLSAYQEPEIVSYVTKHHHAGLVVASADPERVQSLLEAYTERFYTDFYASLPPPDKPTM